MLSIARALMLNPTLLLLDEPSEGLAPMIVQEIIEVLKGLKREGLAILLVEQNLRTAFALGDRHHVMNKGEICFTGTSAELESNEARAAQLSECLNGLSAVIPGRRAAAKPESILRSDSASAQGLWIPALASLGRNDGGAFVYPATANWPAPEIAVFGNWSFSRG